MDTMETLRQALRHPDPSQLGYQLAEIVGDRCYLQHGIDVGDGDVVLDVGANVGVAAAFFATECRAGAVHSFEPVAPIFEQLRENLANFPRCVPHPFGISSKSGTRAITYYPESWALSGTHADPDADRERAKRIFLNLGAEEEKVETGLRGRFATRELTAEFWTLSHALRAESIDRVDLLKVDVEGSELEVLEGIEDDDWPVIRQVVAELHVDPGGRERMVATLEGHGFDVTVAQDAMSAGTSVHLLYAVRR